MPDLTRRVVVLALCASTASLGCARASAPRSAERSVPIASLGLIESGETKLGVGRAEGLPGYYFRGRRGEVVELSVQNLGGQPEIAILVREDGTAIEAARLAEGAVRMISMLPADGYYFVAVVASENEPFRVALARPDEGPADDISQTSKDTAQNDRGLH